MFFNKCIAIIMQAEDYIAEAFVKIGNLEPATKHCKASIKVFYFLNHLNTVVNFPSSIRVPAPRDE